MIIKYIYRNKPIKIHNMKLDYKIYFVTELLMKLSLFENNSILTMRTLIG